MYIGVLGCGMFNIYTFVSFRNIMLNVPLDLMQQKLFYWQLKK